MNIESGHAEVRGGYAGVRGGGGSEKGRSEIGLGRAFRRSQLCIPSANLGVTSVNLCVPFPPDPQEPTC